MNSEQNPPPSHPFSPLPFPRGEGEGSGGRLCRIKEANPEVRIENLSKTYPNGVRALENVSLTIPRGMYGLLGPDAPPRPL
jgi:ABC-type multidrug transport system fused ATPase/permease subunit